MSKADILKGVNRGCTIEDAMNALKLLKNSCFKVDAHWMPDLPNSSPKIDREMFDYILNSDSLQFDQWKVYPTATVPWTKIKKWYDAGEYTPYTEKNPEDLIDVLLDMMRKVHPWIRLNRVVRDIPNTTRDGQLYIYAGNKVTNLRQILHDRLKERGEFCSCIRSREVKNKLEMIECAKTIVREYKSSEGYEYFISIESGNNKNSIYSNGNWYNNNTREPGIMYGFLRLRLTNNSGNKYLPELYNSALVRELHVYGQVTSKHNKNKEDKAQHSGFGKMLMKKAEEISIENGYAKIAVISGIGVRNYYKQIGYKIENTYMVKYLHQKNNFITLLPFIIVFISIITIFIKNM